MSCRIDDRSKTKKVVVLFYFSIFFPILVVDVTDKFIIIVWFHGEDRQREGWGMVGGQRSKQSIRDSVPPVKTRAMAPMLSLDSRRDIYDKIAIASIDVIHNTKSKSE